MSSINSVSHEKSSPRSLRLSGRKFTIIQFSLISGLIVLSFLVFLVAHVLGINTQDYRSAENILGIFDVGKEQSLPTWFSSINLLVSSLLLICHFVQTDNSKNVIRFYWLCLAILFLVLSIDEVVGLHNMPGHISWYLNNRPQYFPEFLRDFFHSIGIGHRIFKTHTWIPFGILFVVVVGALFVPFLWSIDRRLAMFMVLSGVIFVSGSVGMEVVASWMERSEFAARGTFIRNLAVLIEEAMEMFGIALFNSVLFIHVAKKEFNLHVCFIHSSSSSKTRYSPAISKRA